MRNSIKYRTIKMNISNILLKFNNNKKLYL